jgi:hypothetical protein
MLIFVIDETGCFIFAAMEGFSATAYMARRKSTTAQQNFLIL